MPRPAAGPHPTPELQLVVQPLGRSERRPFAARGRALAARAPHRNTADDQRRAPAVIGQRHVPIARRQRMVRAEQPSDVAGVDDRGVEVGVVADLDGQAQLGVGERHERARLRPGPVGPQHRAHRAAQAPVGLRPQRQQAVEGGRLAGRGDDLRRTVEEPQLTAAPEIEHLVADGDSEARHVRPPAAAGSGRFWIGKSPAGSFAVVTQLRNPGSCVSSSGRVIAAPAPFPARAPRRAGPAPGAAARSMPSPR